MCSCVVVCVYLNSFNTKMYTSLSFESHVIADILRNHKMKNSNRKRVHCFLHSANKVFSPGPYPTVKYFRKNSYNTRRCKKHATRFRQSFVSFRNPQSVCKQFWQTKSRIALSMNESGPNIHYKSKKSAIQIHTDAFSQLFQE